MENMWSTFIQTSEELYASRSVRFREDNKDLWLAAMKLYDELNILEIGCGGGLFCHRIKTFLPNCIVTGLDRDIGHIQFAVEKSKELDLDCSFIQGDALNLPFDNNSFDACTSHTVIEHVETTGFLKEQYRVLKPNGVISVLSVRTSMNIYPENSMPDNQEEQTLLNKAWENANSYDKAHGVGQYELKEVGFPIALESAGFINVNVNFIAVTCYAPDNNAFSREMALSQINCYRISTLESVNKALRINPHGLTQTEKETLITLINKRFDDRILLYEQGQKLWDMATSNVMVTTGNKPIRSVNRLKI